MESFVKTTERQSTSAGDVQAFPGLQFFRAALLIVVVCTTYLSVPLTSGGRLLVPSVATVALMPLLLLVVWRDFKVSDGVFLLKVGFVLVLSIAFSPGLVYAKEKVFGLAQFLMALFVALAVVRLMRQLETRVLERALLVLTCLILVGCLLEVAGIIVAASDAFREWAYRGVYTLYKGLERDINMVGWLRPKLFSVEPSHVTKLFVATANAWLLVRVSWPKVWMTVFATLVMVVIMGSPMLLVSGAITAAIVFWNREANARTKVGMVCGAVIVAAGFGIYSAESQYSVIADRLSTIGEPLPEEDERMGSEEQRIVYPYVALSDTWARWPFFGVGISGKEVIYESSGFSVRDPNAAVGNNAFAETGIYLGIVGSILFAYVMARGVRQTGIARLGLFALIVVLFSQLMGGVVSFRYWGYIALLWGALAVADSREPAETR